MYPQTGRLPETSVFIALLQIFLIVDVAADSRAPLTLAEAEDIALAEEPGRAALLFEVDALQQQSIVAGQLPDPTLRIGLANYPLSGGSFSTEGMTQAQIGFRQSFPKGDSRAQASSRLSAMAAGRQQTASARSREILVLTRSAWLDAYYWGNAKQTLQQSRSLFADLVAVTQSMYSVGRKTQYDVLRAELELARLDDRLIDADRALAAAQASLSQWLGDAAYRSTAPNLPDWRQIPALQQLQASVDRHPMLLAADAVVTAEHASVNLAAAKKKPGWALDVGYGYREGLLPNGQPRSDFISMSVTFDLPVFKKNRQDRDLAAALSQRSSAKSSRIRIAAELQSQLAVEYSRWQELTRRMTLFEGRILDLSSAQADAAMLAYQSDAGTFADVMQATIGNLDTQLEHTRLTVERARSYAALANLGGIPR